jgi:ABC-type dipeptide/oligopeptide/nickel transport system ATPase subunit
MIPEKNISAFQCSGGQKFIIDIAIRISLLNISRDRPKFIIIDEGFGSLDGEHLENIQTFMRVIDDFYKKEKNWILFVSHINELRDISSNKININLINDRSSVNNISAEELEKNKKIISDLGNIKSTSEPSIKDFVLESDGKYFCRYCKKSYVFSRLDSHLLTEIHKKNYMAEYKKK